MAHHLARLVNRMLRCGQNYVEQFPNPRGWWADWIVEEGAPSCMIQILRSGRCVLRNEIRLAGAEEVCSISTAIQ
jgi:hypothetical protein